TGDLSWPEDTLTPSVKNTTMLLSGQNFRLQAKNVCRSKTPGLHLSVAQGAVKEEVAGRLTSAAPTRLDSLPRRSPAPHPDGVEADVGALLLRLAPMKLAPLQRPEEKQNPSGTRRTSGHARKKLPEGPALARASAPAEAAEARHRPAPGARPVPAGPAERTADRPLRENAVCRGAPAPAMHNRPSPPSPFSKSPTPATVVPCQRPPGADTPQETGRRRLRLRTPRHLEEGNPPTGAPKPPASGAPTAPQAKDQRAERALREADRMLENAAKRNAQQQQLDHQCHVMADGGLEVSGRAIRRTAVANLQDLVL
ncbi:hypothetical protein NHX12_024176, partial [Muraenolepis orangiensis]